MKPNSYTQIYIQLVIAVRFREALLNKEIQPIVFKYISSVITKMGHKSIIVNGVTDHVHILIGLDSTITIAETVQRIKRESSLFINQNKLCKFHFRWQEGYGAFSYSHSSINKVYNYIKNQDQQHKEKTFKTEYTSFLKAYEVEFEDQFLFYFGE